MTDEAKKEALRELRQSRKKTIEAVRERVKQSRAVTKKLSEALSESPKTVPELAKETGIPTEQVLWRLTSMKKYGKVAEGDQDGDYFKYALLKE